MSDDLSAVRNNKAGLQGKGTTCTREEDCNFTWNGNKRNIVNQDAYEGSPTGGLG